MAMWLLAILLCTTRLLLCQDLSIWQLEAKQDIQQLADRAIHSLVFEAAIQTQRDCGIHSSVTSLAIPMSAARQIHLLVFAQVLITILDIVIPFLEILPA